MFYIRYYVILFMPFHVPAWQSQLYIKEKPKELQIVSTCIIDHFALITYKEMYQAGSLCL